MNSKGQITIPSKVRKQLGIEDGTYLQIEIDLTRKQIILIPINHDYIRGLHGKYRGKGLMKALISEKQRESEL